MDSKGSAVERIEHNPPVLIVDYNFRARTLDGNQTLLICPTPFNICYYLVCF